MARTSLANSSLISNLSNHQILLLQEMILAGNRMSALLNHVGPISMYQKILVGRRWAEVSMQLAKILV